MFIPFENIPDHANVWVYPASRILTDIEASKAEAMIESFVQQWLSHQREVTGSGTILNNRFIILTADEALTDVSGCSIDSSVRFVRQLEETFSIQLFDRTHMYFMNDAETVEQTDFRNIGQAWEAGLLKEQTMVVNLQVRTMGELRNQWLVPFMQSQYARFLPVVK